MDYLNNPQLVQTAKLIAVPLPFALAGFSFGFSYITVPFLYDQHASVSTPFIVNIVKLGGLFVAPGSCISAAAALYLAGSLPAQRSTWTFAAATVAMPIVWTLTVMLPSSINRITAISENKVVQEKATVSLEARQLLKKWVWQNSVRAGLWLAAGVTAVSATVGA